MKRKQVEMTYLLYSQRPRNARLPHPGYLGTYSAASTAVYIRLVRDQPCRMSYVETECFQNAFGEYDIPVIPRRMHPHWWAML